MHFLFLFFFSYFLYKNLKFDVPFSNNSFSIYFYSDPNKENLILLLNSIFPVFPTDPKPVKEYFNLNNKIQISKIKSYLFKKNQVFMVLIIILMESVI